MIKMEYVKQQSSTPGSSINYLDPFRLKTERVLSFSWVCGSKRCPAQFLFLREMLVNDAAEKPGRVNSPIRANHQLER